MDIANLHQSSTWREQLASRLSAVPVPLYGGALALLGLCLLLPFTWPWTRELAFMPWLRGAGVLALLAGGAVHVAKACLANTSFTQDVRNPVVAPFFGQIGVGLALLAEILQGSHALTAQLALFGSTVLAILSLVHAAWLAGFKRPSWRDASPSWLLPSIQYLYLGVLAGEHLAWIRPAALALGGVSAIIAIACLVARLWKGPVLPAPARPALTIMVAIPSVALLAALQQPDPSGWPIPTAFGLTLAAYLLAVVSMPLGCRCRLRP